MLPSIVAAIRSALLAAMLCVSRVSGEPVLELGADEFDDLTSLGGSAVRALKQRVRRATGIGIFRQSLVRNGCVLEGEG